MSLADEYFGTTAQQDLARRARALFEVVKDDSRFTYYGRGVGIVRPQDGGIDLMSAVIALSGACHFAATEDDDVPQIEAALRDRGLSTTVFVRWTGGDETIARARVILAQTACPPDVTIHKLSADSPTEHLIKLAEVAETGGVLAPAGSVLRGQTRPGLGIVALDAHGRAVSCAGAAGFCHPDHPEYAAQCWWGMLATHPDRLGESLALILGAMALIEMRDRYGFASVMNGVVAGNAASEGLCKRLGLSPDGKSVVSAVDALMVPGGRITK
jgi:hypothetical protein